MRNDLRWSNPWNVAGNNMMTATIIYLIENPERSRIWSEESVLEMLEYTNGQIVKCHSGAYGGKNSKGEPIKKTFQFASNNPMLLGFLTKKLSAEQLALCVPLEGKPCHSIIPSHGSSPGNSQGHQEGGSVEKPMPFPAQASPG